MAEHPSPHAKPWMLFAIPLAIVVPVIAGLLLGGPGLGIAIAVLAAIVIVAVAIRAETPEQRAAAPPEPRWPLRATAKRFAAPAAVVVAGLVVAVVTDGTARIIGWGVVALGLTLAICLLFLEIGYSEDRARAEEHRRGTR